MLKDPLLKRYWFATSAIMGFGVTAYSLEDARELLRQCEFIDSTRIQDIAENIDIQALDANHIRSNMGPPNFRGVWFPFACLV